MGRRAHGAAVNAPLAKCKTCRFWSEMVAQAHGGGPVEALCLAEGGPLSGRYTPGFGRCAGWKHDELGKVDDPPNYGEWNRAAYIEAEGPLALHAAQVPA